MPSCLQSIKAKHLQHSIIATSDITVREKLNIRFGVKILYHSRWHIIVT